MTTNSPKGKLVIWTDPQLLSALRAMSQTEGCQLQVLIDEALRDYVERKQGNSPRCHVMSALDDSLIEHDDLFRKLAE